jgi:isoleucyl-tRNA synthetase
VDKVFLKCPKCSGMMHRVVDTVDTWMDAAMIPFYTLDWLNNKKYFNEWFPAELVLECGPGQYRLWFFFMLLTGVTLTGKAPYKNVFTYELVKDIHGREMHKSWGNAIWFDEAVEKIGADLLRYVYIKHDPHQNLNFGFELADEPRRVLTILFNIGNYVKELPEFSKIKNQDLQIEDKWILSRLNHVVQDATKYMEDFKPDFYLKTIEDFFVTDLSRTYIQIIRERVQQDNKTKNAALYTLFNSYINILKLLAPTIPFLTENVYQELKKKFNLKEESLHLCDWTVADEKAIDEKLEKKFEQVRKVIEKALAIRVEKQTNIRWPLKKITIKVEEDIKDFSEVIKRQTNVKEIIIKKEKIAEPEVELDFSMNKEFEEEGYLREIIRVMQDARKKASLKKDQEIEMSINCDDFIKNIISKNEKNIKTVVNISLIKFLKTTKQKSQTKKKIKDHEIEVYF